jgi:hypothetical protein
MYMKWYFLLLTFLLSNQTFTMSENNYWVSKENEVYNNNAEMILLSFKSQNLTQNQAIAAIIKKQKKNSVIVDGMINRGEKQTFNLQNDDNPKSLDRLNKDIDVTTLEAMNRDANFGEPKIPLSEQQVQLFQLADEASKQKHIEDQENVENSKEDFVSRFRNIRENFQKSVTAFCQLKQEVEVVKQELHNLNSCKENGH